MALGEPIPAGLTVFTSPYALHHNTDYFRTRSGMDLNAGYHPPIFTEASKDGQSGLQRLVFGPAQLCENLATTTVLLTFATVMWSRDFCVAEGEVERLVKAAHTWDMEGINGRTFSCMTASRYIRTELYCNSSRDMLRARERREANFTRFVRRGCQNLMDQPPDLRLH